MLSTDQVFLNAEQLLVKEAEGPVPKCSLIFVIWDRPFNMSTQRYREVGNETDRHIDHLSHAKGICSI